MIAREGWPFILIGLALTVVLILLATRANSFWLFGLSAIFALVTLFVTFFFRDPNRTFAVEPGLLVSPADGKVIKIEQIASHPFIGGPATKISIFLSVFDVHVNRVPASGVIADVKYNPGEFFVAYADKASEKNEQTEIGMTTDSGDRILFKQIAGYIARRIVCRLKAGDTVAAGQRFGLIRFGSRTELFMPASASILVKTGDRVYGGETPMARLAINHPTVDRARKTESYEH
ncbi:phosphatidylserine decarboxylase family protein [candidate division GN15 bacterium]|uniref:Phosphatidylserine decarboxylase proenzyme n=1 Tax=candidate division GN15 bacterium TaxID=2072418 RepID=A0A855X6D8_9BACT|nr:MAG: phosphatidylserine decarboxylase family protein [candidate division GN15 bacterium]